MLQQYHVDKLFTTINIKDNPVNITKYKIPNTIAWHYKDKPCKKQKKEKKKEKKVSQSNKYGIVWKFKGKNMHLKITHLKRNDIKK